MDRFFFDNNSIKLNKKNIANTAGIIFEPFAPIFGNLSRAKISIQVWLKPRKSFILATPNIILKSLRYRNN